MYSNFFIGGVSRNYSRWWQPIMVKIHLIRSSIYLVGLLVEILITFAENIWILGNKTAPAVGPKKVIRMCERGPCLLTSSLICGQANKSSGNNCLRLNSHNNFTSFHWNSALPSSRWNSKGWLFTFGLRMPVLVTSDSQFVVWLIVYPHPR